MISQEQMSAQESPQPAQDGWQQALDDLERALREAARAAGALRRSLTVDSEAPEEVASNVRELPQPPQPAAWESEEGAAPAGSEALSAFERVWSRLEAERLGKQGDVPPPPKEALDPVDKVSSKLLNLPGQFLLTIEDRESRVDLVPLHRALIRLPGVEDVSLASFANGVPVIAVRVAGELDHEQLSKAVGMAMDRECEVIPHENGKLFLRLTPREGGMS